MGDAEEKGTSKELERAQARGKKRNKEKERSLGSLGPYPSEKVCLMTLRRVTISWESCCQASVNALLVPSRPFAPYATAHVRPCAREGRLRSGKDCSRKEELSWTASDGRRTEVCQVKPNLPPAPAPSPCSSSGSLAMPSHRLFFSRGFENSNAECTISGEKIKTRDEEGNRRCNRAFNSQSNSLIKIVASPEELTSVKSRCQSWGMLLNEGRQLQFCDAQAQGAPHMKIHIDPDENMIGVTWSDRCHNNRYLPEGSCQNTQNRNAKEMMTHRRIANIPSHSARSVILIMNKKLRLDFCRYVLPSTSPFCAFHILSSSCTQTFHLELVCSEEYWLTINSKELAQEASTIPYLCIVESCHRRGAPGNFIGTPANLATPYLSHPPLLLFLINCPYGLYWSDNCDKPRQKICKQLQLRNRRRPWKKAIRLKRKKRKLQSKITIILSSLADQRRAFPSRLSAFKMADEGDVQTAERIKAAATVDFLFSDGNFLFTSRRIGVEVNLQSSDFILRPSWFHRNSGATSASKLKNAFLVLKIEKLLYGRRCGRRRGKYDEYRFSIMSQPGKTKISRPRTPKIFHTKFGGHEFQPPNTRNTHKRWLFAPITEVVPGVPCRPQGEGRNSNLVSYDRSALSFRPGAQRRIDGRETCRSCRPANKNDPKRRGGVHLFCGTRRLNRSDHNPQVPHSRHRVSSQDESGQRATHGTPKRVYGNVHHHSPSIQREKRADEDGQKIEGARVDYDTSRIKIKSASYLAGWKKLQTVEKIQTSIVATEEELKCTDKLKCRIDGTYNGEHHE
ncbi:unnamed protein product [Nesidiocoris tenuis]|uniref:Uncharacterized protein n=1 Tax=Nesidiocoris tenuis TaxID=355587 RepID=A0A6H5GSN9_9HEMI|nr:unnamed protein product [Nesidiocoris tenuis]